MNEPCYQKHMLKASMYIKANVRSIEIDTKLVEGKSLLKF